MPGITLYSWGILSLTRCSWNASLPARVKSSVPTIMRICVLPLMVSRFFSARVKGLAAVSLAEDGGAVPPSYVRPER